MDAVEVDSELRTRTAAAGTAEYAATARANRVAALDIARGLLIVLMTSSHALVLANVPNASFWRSDFWLPRGWATFAFIVLSGFTAARVLPWMQDARRARRILARRAVQLLVIMFLSNAAFQFAKAALGHGLADTATVSWWIDVVTSNTSYGLSGVLLPTSVLLIVVPFLFWFRTKAGWNILAGSIAVATLVAWWMLRATGGSQTPHAGLLDLLVYEGLGGFPVLPLVGCGALGFCLGLRREVLSPRMLGWRLAALVVGAIAIKASLRAQVSPAFLLEVLGTVLNFLVVLHLAMLFERQGNGAIAGTMGLIGQYAIFSFLAHRAILQSMAAVLHNVTGQTPTTLYLAYFIGGMLMLWMLCWWRSQTSVVNARLKAVGL